MKTIASGEAPYEVGYGRPPTAYRFRKGVSGNPKGRRKGTPNFATLFMKAMTKTVTVTENGKRKRISKLDAAVRQLANDAARGDQKALRLIIELLPVCEPAVKPPIIVDTVLVRGVLAGGDRTI